MPAPSGNKNAGKDIQRTAHIDVRVTPAEKGEWRAAATARGQTISAMVTKAVTEFLAKERK